LAAAATVFDKHLEIVCFKVEKKGDHWMKAGWVYMVLCRDGVDMWMLIVFGFGSLPAPGHS
jgi:hypothetical protein